jgi:hypothetical protein
MRSAVTIIPLPNFFNEAQRVRIWFASPVRFARVLRWLGTKLVKENEPEGNSATTRQNDLSGW